MLWLRDRRLESNALSETAERGEMSLVGRHSDEVPFGINALIEDTEVDGVWNSKANTAFHGKRQKTRSTSTLRPGTATFKKLKKNPSVSSASTLDMADTGVASPEGQSPTCPFPLHTNTFHRTDTLHNPFHRLRILLSSQTSQEKRQIRGHKLQKT